MRAHHSRRKRLIGDTLGARHCVDGSDPRTTWPGAFGLLRDGSPDVGERCLDEVDDATWPVARAAPRCAAAPDADGAPKCHYPYTAVMASIRIVSAVLAAVLVPAAAFGGSQPVRTPRDSALVVNGVIRPMTGGTPAATPQPRAPVVNDGGTCTSRVVPDPGYRPMWVPGDWCATGLESVWIPGHWVW